MHVWNRPPLPNESPEPTNRTLTLIVSLRSTYPERTRRIRSSPAWKIPICAQYSSCLRHHVYGGGCGQPGGESSHSSRRPYGGRSSNDQTLPRASTPRRSVKYVR